MCRRTTSILASFTSAIVPLLCESLALSQQLIRLDYSTQPRFETAIAAIAVGMIFADEFAVAAAKRRAIGVGGEAEQLHRVMLLARKARIRGLAPRLVHPLPEPRAECDHRILEIGPARRQGIGRAHD